VPAIAETLPGYDFVLWNGVFAPAGTPPDVVTKLNAAIQKVLQDPEIRKSFEDNGSTVVSSSPEEFGKLFSAEVEKMGKLVELAGASAE
jgi:tripartite-type tricarboxylate transporter receptor subunit TctC